MKKQKNPQTGEIIPTQKGRERVGATNFQCSICVNIKKCEEVYTQDLWRDDESCTKFLYDPNTSTSHYPPHVI